MSDGGAQLNSFLGELEGLLGTSIWGGSRIITTFRVPKVGQRASRSSSNLCADDADPVYSFFFSEPIFGPPKWNFQWRNAKMNVQKSDMQRVCPSRVSNLGPRPKLVGFVRVSHTRFCIYSTRKSMGATGRSRWLLEVIHRKAFTWTVGSFSRVQYAWYDPKPQCVMKFLKSFEFQNKVQMNSKWKIFKSTQWQFTTQWKILKSMFSVESVSCFVDTAFAGGATCPAGSF